jgi:hypothetical protein
MLCREIIAVCSEIHTKHINTLCGQKVEFLARSQDCEKQLLASTRLSACPAVRLAFHI